MPANVTPKAKFNWRRAVLCWTIGEPSAASVTLGGEHATRPPASRAVHIVALTCAFALAALSLTACKGKSDAGEVALTDTAAPPAATVVPAGDTAQPVAPPAAAKPTAKPAAKPSTAEPAAVPMRRLTPPPKADDLIVSPAEEHRRRPRRTNGPANRPHAAKTRRRHHPPDTAKSVLLAERCPIVLVADETLDTRRRDRGNEGLDVIEDDFRIVVRKARRDADHQKHGRAMLGLHAERSPHCNSRGRHGDRQVPPPQAATPQSFPPRIPGPAAKLAVSPIDTNEKKNAGGMAMTAAAWT